MDIRPIRNDDDHRAAVLEIDRLWDAPEGSKDADALDVLATLVDAYESDRWPVAASDPIEILRYAIDEMGRKRSWPGLSGRARAPRRYWLAVAA
jgi:HTH-type transcriptional regulator / antitoxin HigA